MSRITTPTAQRVGVTAHYYLNLRVRDLKNGAPSGTFGRDGLAHPT